MKANRAQIERALDTASADVRLFLLHGPDEAQSRDLAVRLTRRMGAGADRVDLSGAQLKADPARLADEAASISLFGDARYVRIEPAGDEVFDAVVALLEAPSAGNPAVLVAGALRKDSRLLKRALADPAVLAFASYLPEGSDIDRLAGSMARARGLRLDPDVVGLLAAASGGDRALLDREIDKLALFADADTDRPAALDLAMFEALSADNGDGHISRLIDDVTGGRASAIPAELARLSIAGIEGIGLLRPLLRRLFLLAELRSDVDRGQTVEAAIAKPGRAVFWKEKATISRQVAGWTSDGLAKAISRLLAVERAVKAPGSSGDILVESELLVIARYAAR